MVALVGKSRCSKKNVSDEGQCLHRWIVNRRGGLGKEHLGMRGSHPWPPPQAALELAYMTYSSKHKALAFFVVSLLL